MDYELAKELKDEGFPQKSGNHLSDAKNCKAHGCMKGLPLSCHTAYLPTLSELIEACGEEFDSLDAPVWDLEKNPTWEASAMYDPHSLELPEIFYEERGKTPEEAVARLWLALNKK